MANEVLLMAGTAAAIGFGHTALGPDHYLPFIVLPSVHGLRRMPIRKLERHSHALAGLAILPCGAAIRFLGQ